MKEFPILKDIRFYKHHEENQYKFDSVGLGLDFTHTIGCRFANYLNNRKFRIGPFDHIYIYLRESKTSDSFVVRQFPNEWCRSIDYSVNLSQLSKADPYEFVCRLISKVLVEFTDLFDTPSQEIENLTTLAIAEKDRLRIPQFECKVGDLSLHFYIVIRENYGDFAQLFVDVYDRRSGSQNTYFVVESYVYELKSLVSKATIENRTMLLHPRKSNRAQLDVQSFEYPATKKIGHSEVK